MMYSNGCGGYCEPESFVVSKKDKEAFLKEKEAILEAKLATIRHMIETLDEDKSESESLKKE